MRDIDKVSNFQIRSDIAQDIGLAAADAIGSSDPNKK